MRFYDAFINKCLEICVMFFPVIIWDIFMILQLFLPFPNVLFIGINIVVITCLCFTILFGNSFCKVEYKEEVIKCKWRKRKPLVIIKKMILGIPILLCCFFFYTIPLYVYGGIQLLFMIFDKEHLTLNERFYEKSKKVYFQYKQNKTINKGNKKKE